METSTILSIVLFVIAILFGIIGYQESQARKRNEESIEELKGDLKELRKEFNNSINNIRDGNSNRNELVNGRFSDLKELLLQRINELNANLSKLTK